MSFDGERARRGVWTIVVGGGGGQRFGGPKQYELLAREPSPVRVLDASVAMARRAGDGVVVVVPAADAEREGGIAGGASRSESVRAGLAAVPSEATVICVHDAARPLASAELFAAVIAAVTGDTGVDGAVPAVAVTDTIKVVDGAGRVVSTPDRASLVAVQTPQAFRADALRRAHADACDGTDDAALVERSGGVVVVVPGEPENAKITTPDDLERARARWASR